MATDPAPWCGKPLPDDRDGWRTRALAFRESAEAAEDEVERLRVEHQDLRDWAEALEAWASSVLWIVKERRIPSAEVIADGERISAAVRSALGA